MDVVCAGMYRACSTWQYDVAADLIEHHRDGQRLGYVTGEHYHAPDADGTTTWRVLKSHEEHRRFRAVLDQGRALVIYAHRDIRDVVFSMLHKRQVTFEAFLRSGMVHQILANDRFWTTRPRVLVQRYDDLVANPAAGVRQLADYLGIALSKGEAESVASEYSITKNRERIQELTRRMCAAGMDIRDPQNAQRYDGHTLLHWNHLRAESGANWRDRATARQVAILARIGAAWLIEHGYERDDSWARVATMAGRSTEPWGVATRLREELDLTRGRLSCSLRCASARHPALAGFAKRLLRIPVSTPAATPITAPSTVRIDTQSTATATGPKQRAFNGVSHVSETAPH